MVKFVINPHSFVDLITNSSTELFVTDTKKSVEFVREILCDLLAVHNKINGQNLLFEDVFLEPYYCENTSNTILAEWTDYYKDIPKSGILIEGVSDNSIPYWMFEPIEEAFGGRRYHLG